MRVFPNVFILAKDKIGSISICYRLVQLRERLAEEGPKVFADVFLPWEARVMEKLLESVDFLKGVIRVL